MKFSDLKSSILEQFKTTNEVVPFIVGKPGGGPCVRAWVPAYSFSKN